MSGLPWPGSEPRYFFWPKIFLLFTFVLFAAIKSCFGNACDIQIIQRLWSHLMFLQSIIFCSLLVHMGSPTALRDTFVCFWAQIRKCSRAWCSFDYMMLGFHEILTFQKAIFHSICLRWTNFNETSLMSGITLTLFFASVSESSSRLFWWLFNVFWAIRSCCISINLERNSYLFHTFFRLLWTFFIVGGFDSYKKTFNTSAVGCLNEWFDAAVRL